MPWGGKVEERGRKGFSGKKREERKEERRANHEIGGGEGDGRTDGRASGTRSQFLQPSYFLWEKEIKRTTARKLYFWSEILGASGNANSVFPFFAVRNTINS